MTSKEPYAFTVDEFCQTHRISRGLFYKLLKQGKGPRLMRGVGRRPLISLESAQEWRRAMESAA